MCNKHSANIRGISPFALKMAKITVVVVFFCFAECAAGSCLSYGHSCWGGHGKRSGNHNIPDRESGNIAAPRWFLSRLIQSPADLRYGSDKDLAPGQQQLFANTQMEVDPLKGQDIYANVQDVLTEDENALLEDLYPRQRLLPGKNRAKRLTKRSTKLM